MPRPATAMCASQPPNDIDSRTDSSAAAAMPSDATKSGRRGIRSKSGPAPTTPTPSPAASTEASSPDLARSRPSSRARSAWCAPGNTSTTPKARKEAAKKAFTRTPADCGTSPTGSHLLSFARLRLAARLACRRSPSAHCARGFAALALQHSQFELRRLRHHRRRPRRIPDEIERHRRHAFDTARLRLHLGWELLGRRAHRRREGHADGGRALGVDLHLVDEAELVDVDGNLRIEDGLQLLDDLLADLAHRLGRFDDASRLGARALRAGVLALHAHSVLTGSPPSSAARSACQQSVAHLTRSGNSWTPAKTSSLPSEHAGRASPVVTS